ncbi:MAG TPA: hypothetical protein VMJ75_29625, partial [Candidatus Acidoferrales bacterium]|nr:hypothetical protein [Candidatus Acidoferrales bacterium]
MRAQVGDPLAQQRTVRHDGPLPVADYFPTVQVLAVEQRFPIGGCKNHREEKREEESEFHLTTIPPFITHRT